MRMMRWGLGVAGLAVAGAVVVGALGLGVGAQAEEGEKNGLHALYLDLVAEKLGVTVDELQAAQEAARGEALDEAVATGVITAELAERIRNHEPGAGRHRGGRMSHAIKNIFGAAAALIGSEPEARQDELLAGKSLAEVGADNGVSRDDLKAGIISSVEAELQAALDAGKITAEQYDAMLAGLNDRIEEVLDRTGFRTHGDRVETDPTS